MNLIQNYAFFNSTQDWLIILVVVLVLFGGKKIPELMRVVGKGMGELQKGLEEGKSAMKASMEEAKTETKPTTPAATPPTTPNEGPVG